MRQRRDRRARGGRRLRPNDEAAASECSSLKVATGSTDPAGFDVVVNATPLGMKEGEPPTMDVGRISPSTFVGEVGMKREITHFLAAVCARG